MGSSLLVQDPLIVKSTGSISMDTVGTLHFHSVYLFNHGWHLYVWISSSCLWQHPCKYMNLTWQVGRIHQMGNSIVRGGQHSKYCWCHNAVCSQHIAVAAWKGPDEKWDTALIWDIEVRAVLTTHSSLAIQLCDGQFKANGTCPWTDEWAYTLALDTFVFAGKVRLDLKFYGITSSKNG